MIKKVFDEPEIYLLVYKIPKDKGMKDVLNDFRYSYTSIILHHGLCRGRYHLIAAAYHFLEIGEKGRRWIRDDNYRFAAFILMEDQINKIGKILGKYEKDTIVVLSPKIIKPDGYEDYDLDEGDIGILSELAIFRLRVEQERLSKKFSLDT